MGEEEICGDRRRHHDQSRSRNFSVITHSDYSLFLPPFMHKSILRSGNGLAKHASRSLHSNPPPANITQITTLPNKIRVATNPTPGYFSSVGLYVGAGSRHETPETSGASHFIDRLAFKVC